MRRRDRELTDWKEFKNVLDDCKVIRIGMHDSDGIYILPMNYGYELEEDGQLTFYMHCGLKGKKLDLISDCPDVAFELDCDHTLIKGNVPCQYGYGYASIMGNGRITVLEDPQEKMHALTNLMKCQADKSFTFNERLVSIVTVLKLETVVYTGKRRPIK